MGFPECNFTTDEKTEITITRLLYLILFSGIVLVVAQNPDQRWLLFFLAGLLVISVTIRRAIIYESSRHLQFGLCFFLFDLGLIYSIVYLDRSLTAYIFYLALIVDAALTYSTFVTGGIALISLLLNEFAGFSHIKSLNLKLFGSRLLIDSLIFSGTHLLMTFVRYQIQQKEHLRQLMVQLKIKTKELETTYQKLKEASIELEDITVLRERNRIAREIHDTVGHTLTTVLLELEAGERLIPLDPATAATKIQLAKGQIRKGLNDIRTSVETLKTGNDMLDFVSALKLLIHETMLHGDIHIKYRIEELPLLDPRQEKTLYRALQEGLTNGIRHGKSTAFVFNLKRSGDWIEFFLQDNGAGAAQIVPGFGLTTMEERVKELGGIFHIQNNPEEGCLIRVSLPLQEEPNYAG